MMTLGQEETSYALFGPPTVRLMSALANIGLAGNDEVRVAAHALTDPVRDLILAAPKRQADWDKATKELDHAMTQFQSVAADATCRQRNGHLGRLRGNFAPRQSGESPRRVIVAPGVRRSRLASNARRGGGLRWLRTRWQVAVAGRSAAGHRASA